MRTTLKFALAAAGLVALAGCHDMGMGGSAATAPSNPTAMTTTPGRAYSPSTPGGAASPGSRVNPVSGTASSNGGAAQ